jgi:hypothetical protein
VERKTNAEVAETAEDAEKKGSGDWLPFERKNPPFANTAKDGTPSSIYAGRLNLRVEKPKGTFWAGNAFLVIGPAFAATPAASAGEHL